MRHKNVILFAVTLFCIGLTGLNANKLYPKGWHVSTDAEWTTLTTYSKTRDHTIGESYGGGIVFYLTEDGKHGLVAATQDQSSTTTWYEAQNIISNPANHSVEGKKYTDWRLPTKYELNLLYLQKTVVGNFANLSYWSSSENYYNSAWGQNFSNGAPFNGSKLATLSVRAVRVF